MSDVVLLAAVTALAPTIAVVVSNHYQVKRLKDIHQLVNSRLTKALRQIASLERQLKVKGPRGRKHGPQRD